MVLELDSEHSRGWDAGVTAEMKTNAMGLCVSQPALSSFDPLSWPPLSNGPAAPMLLESQPGTQQPLHSVLEYINKAKLTDNKPLRPPQAVLTENRTLVGQLATAGLGWVQPSGPRKRGEGTEDAEQGIMRAYVDPATGGAMVVITLVAAGFIVGERGKHIRAIQERTGTHILSANSDTIDRPDKHRNTENERPNRKFLITGDPSGVAQALQIITDAVDHYKALTEGACAGQRVDPMVCIHGISFQYSAPPRHSVPYAAGIRGPHRRAKMARGTADSRGSGRILEDVRQCLENQEQAMVAAAAAAVTAPSFGFLGAGLDSSQYSHVQSQGNGSFYPGCHRTVDPFGYSYTPKTPPSSFFGVSPPARPGTPDDFSTIPVETAAMLLNSPFKSKASIPFELEDGKDDDVPTPIITRSSARSLNKVLSSSTMSDNIGRISPTSTLQNLASLSRGTSADSFGGFSTAAASMPGGKLPTPASSAFLTWTSNNMTWNPAAQSVAPATPIAGNPSQLFSTAMTLPSNPWTGSHHNNPAPAWSTGAPWVHGNHPLLGNHTGSWLPLDH